jgi:hypothetical protein
MMFKASIVFQVMLKGEGRECRSESEFIVFLKWLLSSSFPAASVIKLNGGVQLLFPDRLKPDFFPISYGGQPLHGAQGDVVGDTGGILIWSIPG